MITVTAGARVLCGMMIVGQKDQKLSDSLSTWHEEEAWVGSPPAYLWGNQQFESECFGVKELMCMYQH